MNEKMKKSSAINHKLCQGKDVFERMNFLHQASILVGPKNPALASYYHSIMFGCARKSVLRIDHNIKRSICKSCVCPLIPGETSRVRIRKKKVVTTCLICKKVKKLPTDKDNKLWWDNPQALVETYDYSLKTKENINSLDKITSNNINKDSQKHRTEDTSASTKFIATTQDVKSQTD